MELLVLCVRGRQPSVIDNKDNKRPRRDLDNPWCQLDDEHKPGAVDDEDDDDDDDILVDTTRRTRSEKASRNASE